jgi:hypothetical protein
VTQKYNQDFIDKHRNINVDHDWWDYTYYDFRRICEILGIDLDTGEPCFSGFWSQGDGASWAGTYRSLRHSYGEQGAIPTYDLAPVAIRGHAPQDEELHHIADELCLLARIYGPTYATVSRRNRHYAHSNTMLIGQWEYMDEDIDMDEVDEAIIDHVEEALLHTFQALAEWLYRTLEQEYDHLTSDEVVIEALEACGIEEELE